MEEMVRIVDEKEYEDDVISIVTAYYDTDKNAIYTKYSDGTEEWNEFNTGIIRQTKHDGGREIISEYEDNYTKAHHKIINTNGDIDDESWMEYNESWNPIHVKRANEEFWNTYDKYNRLIYQKRSDGSELVIEYDENGRIVRHGDPNGKMHEQWLSEDKIWSNVRNYWEI